jgi:hypothetical protein
MKSRIHFVVRGKHLPESEIPAQISENHYFVSHPHKHYDRLSESSSNLDPDRQIISAFMTTNSSNHIFPLNIL